MRGTITQLLGPSGLLMPHTEFLPLKGDWWDFPGSPVVKTSPSNAGGCRFDPWSGS